MTPLREWLKPPRSLLFLLFAVTLVAVSALGWFGWKLLEQERMVEAQRAQERLEQAADRVAASAREALAETGERLGAWAIAPPADGKPELGLLLVVANGSVTAIPGRRLLYRPSPPSEPEAPTDLFSDGEVLEFQQAQPQRAIEWYQRLADSKTPAIRAGALMRIARVLRKSGRTEEARAAYAQLARIAGARVAGVPAELAGLHALCEPSGRKAEAEELRRDLTEARWQLTRGQFEFYWSEAARLSGDQQPAPAEAVELSQVVERAWNVLTADRSARGQDTIWLDGHPFLLIWRGASTRRAVLVTRPDVILKPAFSAGDVSVAAIDGEGRVVAGRKHGTGRASVRTTAETQLPWTLYLTGPPGSTEAGMLARQRFLLLAMAVMVSFLIAGAWFIARAVQKDLEVSRMQSDFVSAVSHEFRSPLTSIRQLSEMLAFGRVPAEERRQAYYEMLVRETARLQRLVEGLLNFGRMEAGVRQYRFEELEAGALMAAVAAEFELQLAGSGRRIELLAAAEECRIEADPEALGVALRNLVDNALKYSPDCPAVWMEWGPEREDIALRVRDRGPGIPASERRVIFRKFVRGSAAAANVKGSGVGLAMVRHIVAAHGGQIIVESQPGEGSTFTILLPAAARRRISAAERSFTYGGT